MRLPISREKLLKFAIGGPVSRKFELVVDGKVVGELFNQKRDLFYPNFLAVLHRLDGSEIDEVKYYLKGENNVISVKLNETGYELTMRARNFEQCYQEVCQPRYALFLSARARRRTWSRYRLWTMETQRKNQRKISFGSKNITRLGNSKFQDSSSDNY